MNLLLWQQMCGRGSAVIGSVVITVLKHELAIFGLASDHESNFISCIGTQYVKRIVKLRHPDIGSEFKIFCANAKGRLKK